MYLEYYDLMFDHTRRKHLPYSDVLSSSAYMVFGVIQLQKKKIGSNHLRKIFAQVLDNP